MDHFYFGAAEFTVLTGVNGKPWLVAKELCEYLRLKQVNKAVYQLTTAGFSGHGH